MTRKIMRAFKIDEISVVDRPAQSGARALIMKRDSSKVEKGAVLTNNADGHSHLIYCLEDSGGTTSYSSSSGSECGHSHPYVITAEGEIVIGEAEGHSHTALTFGKTEDLVTIVKNLMSTKENNMTKEEIEKLQADLAKSQADNVAKDAELAKAKTLAELTDAEKACMSSMDETKKAEFLGKSADERKAVVKSLTESNPVVYKSLDGNEFRKNDDPRLVAMAKSSDENAKVAKAATEKLEKADLEKRAAELFPNSPGTSEEKGAILKALEAIPDELVRKKAIESAKAGDAALAAAYTRKGVLDGTGIEPGSPEAELDKMAKAYAEQNKVSYHKAYDAVTNTDAGKALYAKTLTK